MAVHAKLLLLVDQNNHPIEDVIVSVPRAAIIDRKEHLKIPNTVAIMDQQGKQFYPRVLTIDKGQSVLFPNSDNIRHHVYSFSAPKAFEIELYSGRNAPPVQFDIPGIVVIGCNIHDQMVGYIYVKDEEITWQSDASGQISVPDNVDEVSLWHPLLDETHNKRFAVKLRDTAVNEPQVVDLTLVEAPAVDSGTVFGKQKFGG